MTEIIKETFLAYHSALSLKQRIQIALLVGAFVFASGSVMPVMVKTWSRPDYSHGFLVPLISLYFIWLKRKELKEIPIVPNFTGGITILISGGLILILSKIGGVAIVQLSSIIIIITGIVLLLLGKKYLQALSFPLGYLFFAVPILDLVLYNISWPLQLFFAKTASILLTFCNIPVFQNAQYLELPNHTLEIVAECSGLSFLVSFTAIGIPLAYFTQRNWLSRALLVAFAVICCLLANLLRITLIGIWTYYGGRYVHGPLHIFTGFFISVVGFVFLFAGAWMLRKTVPCKIKKSSASQRVPLEVIPDDKKFNRAWLLALLILICLGTYVYLYKPYPIPLNRALHELPLTIGEWQGSDMSSYTEGFKAEGADSELIRSYRNAIGREVKLYIGYFESQNQGKEMIYYKLQMLYNNAQEITVQTDPHRTIHINKVVVPDGPDKASLVLYWHDLQGKSVPNRYEAKFLTTIDGLVHRRTNGAIVMVFSNRLGLKEIDRAFNDEIGFVQKIVPVLRNYFPQY
jgi:EpsI family protein